MASVSKRHHTLADIRLAQFNNKVVLNYWFELLTLPKEVYRSEVLVREIRTIEWNPKLLVC